MGSRLTITRLDGGLVPTFLADWEGRPVTIKLDSSAVMKLEGHELLGGRRHFPNGSRGRVAEAAQRILEMRLSQPQSGDVTVVMSALDLD